MTKPNFFIVGAPKCGTTALWDYLRTHPNIFLSEPKEPHYFCDDFSSKYRTCTDEKTYLEKDFSGVTKQHSAVGEASVWYLYSKTAIQNIHTFNPKAKILVMLRNPTDMLYSLHSQLSYNFHEEEKDFTKAWNLQAMRASGENVGALCIEPAFLQYRAIASFGEQLQRAYSHFPREQVKVIFYDKFKSDTAAVYADVLQFVDVPPDGRKEFAVVNANKFHRSEWLGRLLNDTPAPLAAAVSLVKKALGLQTLGLGRLANRINALEIHRAPLPESTRQEIAFSLQTDMELLEGLTGCDLSSWRRDLTHTQAA